MYTKDLGFTLVELIVAVALVAILLTLGVPSFQNVILNNRIATQTNEFITALNLARSEAIKRGRRVVLCKSSDGANCATTGDWEQGWIVFADTDNDAVVDGGEEIVRVFGALAGGNILQGNTPVNSYISYTPEGDTRLTSGAFQAGTLTFGLCSSSGEKNTIVISQTGRARLEKISC